MSFRDSILTRANPERLSTKREDLLVTLQGVVDLAEIYRVESSRHLNQATRGELGQFLTPQPVAQCLAKLFRTQTLSEVSLLDPGAGTGSLTAAAARHLIETNPSLKRLTLVAYEIEPVFLPYLQDVLRRICEIAASANIEATYEIRHQDFISAAIPLYFDDLFSKEIGGFTHAILNPPFKKLSNDSSTRSSLSKIGIECTNLYTAFVWLAARLLAKNGEFAAITPRSFCNGPYFKAFRSALLDLAPPDVFVTVRERDLAFSDDEVLQETVLYHGITGGQKPQAIIIEQASGADLGDVTSRLIPYQEFTEPSDPENFFHIVSDKNQSDIKKQMEQLPCSIENLGIAISTGRVVDFRTKENLLKEPTSDSIPLIYPQHLTGGSIQWPIASKKPNALMRGPATESLLVPMGDYVLLKRFSSKEEKRRIVATYFSPIEAFGGIDVVGLENHINYFHANGRPLDPLLAMGLTLFLNSSYVDDYFRQFSGHTQVNATDLRRLRYPAADSLALLGRHFDASLSQSELDQLVAQTLNFMAESKDALKARKRIEEALAILKALGAPREQQNERTALVLLVIAGIKPSTAWKSASTQRLGITEMMGLMLDWYGKSYKPNTRETIRRFSVHQLVQMGILLDNPDLPERAVNSPNYRYQLDSAALKLLQCYASDTWEAELGIYKSMSAGLLALREREREMTMVPVTLPTGKVIQISAGGQNDLIKAIVEEFCPRFTPKSEVLYLGDAGNKFIVERLEDLKSLGVVLDEHGKMPDLVVHYTERNWLVLIEAVTSHGPINIKRKNELRKIFSKSSAGLVFVTAFATRTEMVRFLPEISWETEVWVADSPTHMVHFNGERFLGPYE